MEVRRIGCTTLGHLYGIAKINANYIIRLADKHGVEILKHKWIYYSPEFELKAINRVFNGEGLIKVSLDLGLPNRGLLSNWIRKYKQNDYSIIELKKGRKNERENQGRAFEGKQGTSKEELRAYCKTRIHKKLNALVSKRENQQKKKSSK